MKSPKAALIKTWSLQGVMYPHTFSSFAGEQVVPAGFRNVLPEIDEYFLQNRGPQHCSIQIMYQDVKWDFSAYQLVAKVKI